MGMHNFIKIINEDVETISEELETNYYGENKFVEHLSKLKNKTQNHDSTLTYIINEDYYEEFLKSSFKILLINKETYEKIRTKPTITYILTESPKESYAILSNYIYKKNNYDLVDGEIDKSAVIDESSFIDKNVQIGKNVRIGRNCSILKNTIIENNVVIGDNCVIGSTGLDSYINNDNDRILIQTIGGVRIRENVTIKNFCNIDRGSGGRFTSIEKGALIGSHTHLAHDVIIGNSSMIIDGSIIAGHVKIGKNVVLGLNTSVLQNIKIHDNARTGIGTVVTLDLKEDKFMIGNPGRILK